MFARGRAQECKGFLHHILGFTCTERRGDQQIGYWLYAGELALIHLMSPGANNDGLARGTGAIDYFAMSCEDIECTEQHLITQGIAYRKHVAASEGLSQLFITDPAGIKIELNFDHHPPT